MTRREWLHRNPPPKAAGTLRDLLSKLQSEQPRTTQISGRIAEVEKELANCARCPQHQGDLVRHNNRPEDLFVCPVGPHFYLWTKVGAIAAFAIQDMSKPIPGLDEKMTWL
jgi:hypothetical protein